MEKPTTDIENLEKRYQAIDSLIEKGVQRDIAREIVDYIIERIGA